jgi:type I restriction enzyme M protein
MADEKGVEVPKGCDWPKLRDTSGTDLTDFYVDLLRTLAKQPGILGDIFADSQSRFNNPVSLKRLINLIDETEWTTLGVDVKAQAYEGLLEKAANEGKKGAGQYSSPPKPNSPAAKTAPTNPPPNCSPVSKPNANKAANQVK